MNPLSILHVTAPGQVGGLESVVRGLALGLGARGHQVAVFASMAEDPADNSFTRALQRGGVEVHSLRGASRNYLQERAAIRRLIAGFGPSVVHTHGYRADVVGLAAAWKGPARRLTTVHGFTGVDWKNRLYERLQFRAFRKFDAVVAVSRPLFDRIRASGVRRERVHLIPNAFAADRPSLERETARQALGLPREGFIIGWVGRLSREKGMDVMMEALSVLADLPVTVAVLGDGSERAVLEAQARTLGVAGRIRWLGVVPEAAGFFPGFDLFVLSSRTEGTPVTLLEAMAARVPIVASAVGGVPDVISEREGWLVSSENPVELAAAIREAWSQPEDRDGRAQAASRRLAEHFATARWLDRYEALYRTLTTPGRKD